MAASNIAGASHSAALGSPLARSRSEDLSLPLVHLPSGLIGRLRGSLGGPFGGHSSAGLRLWATSCTVMGCVGGFLAVSRDERVRAE